MENNSLKFKDIELSDKGWADSLLAISDFQGTEYCFTSLYIWSAVYSSKIARFGDFLIVRSGSGSEAGYLFPAGSGDVKAAIEAMMEDASSLGRKFSLMSLTDRTRHIVDGLFPGEFEFIPVRNSYDYVYRREDLVSLSGRKYQAKRNFIARFMELPGWEYVPVHYDSPDCGELIGECMRMNEVWCRKNGCAQNLSMSQESCAVRRALSDFRQLRLTGGILRAGGDTVAYTVGERLNSDTFIVHVEKAFSEVKGAYPMINRSFIEHEAGDCTYVNREDDAGDEGLRKAKLSYHPAFMIEKYLAVKK